jgi:hypothetical protein
MPFDFNQRVYLRHEPMQFGRIGTTSPTGASFDLENQTQDVFWEHKGAGEIVSSEKISDLMSEEEYHERRRLFIATMRKPEMRTLRAALRDMRHEQGVDWRTIEINEAAIYLPSHSGAWQLVTDRYQIYCYGWDPGHFYFDWFHQEENLKCPCSWCQELRQFKDDGAFFHVENSDGKRLV